MGSPSSDQSASWEWRDLDPAGPRTARRVRRALLAEGVGTFVYTLAGTGAYLLAQHGLLPAAAAHALAPGLAAIALIFSLGDVSGAHINPAVTLAFALRGAFPWRLLLPYWLVQVVGALLAAWLLSAFVPLAPGPARVPASGALLLEVGGSAVLLAVVLATAHQSARLKPSVGLVVGATVTLNHLLTFPLAHVVMNPARALGPALVGGSLGHSWPQLLGPFLGVLLAVLFTWATRGPLNAGEQEAASGEPED